MNTPHAGGGGRRGRPQRSEPRTAPEPIDPVEHVTCSLAALAVVGALVLVGYPLLVVLTQPLRLLSSTAIAFALLSVWLLAWLAIEIVWEWRAGRLSSTATDR